MRRDAIHNLAADLEHWAMSWETFMEDAGVMQGLVADWKRDPEDYALAEDAVRLRDELHDRLHELQGRRQRLAKAMERLGRQMTAWWAKQERLPRQLWTFYDSFHE